MKMNFNGDIFSRENNKKQNEERNDKSSKKTSERNKRGKTERNKKDVPLLKDEIGIPADDGDTIGVQPDNGE